VDRALTSGAAMPRRVISTSGSSGIQGVRRVRDDEA
jgi:hypothetical protein